MLKKKHVKETLDQLPDEFQLENIIDELILLDKIEKGEKQSSNGEVISEEELEKEMEKWFK